MMMIWVEIQDNWIGMLIKNWKYNVILSIPWDLLV
jgi:hypothetical protein